MHHISNMKQNLAEKRQDIVNTPKQTRMQNLVLFWQCLILAKKSQMPFLHQTLQLASCTDDLP